MNQGPLILEPLLFAVFKLLIEAMCVLYVYLSGLIWVSDVIEMHEMQMYLWNGSTHSRADGFSTVNTDFNSQS